MMTNKLLQRLQETNAKINQSKPQRRALLLLLGIILIFIFWYTFIKSPLNQKIQVTELKIQTISNQTTILKGQLTGFRNNSSSIKQKKQDTLTLRQAHTTALQKSEKDIAIYKQEMLPPEKLIPLLEEIITENKDLRLITLTQSSSKKLNALDGSGQTLTQSKLVITLSGNFFNILNYIQKLEAVKWSVFWESLDYKVDNYPTATATLTLYTISHSQEKIR